MGPSGSRRHLRQAAPPAPPAWYVIGGGGSPRVFPAEQLSSSTGQDTPTSISLTYGSYEGTSVVISDDGAPFSASGLCPGTSGAFSLRYSFSLPAAPAALNTLSNGITLAFINATGHTPSAISWAFDVAGMLLPRAGGVSLELDTHDDFCGDGTYVACTGTSPACRHAERRLLSSALF
jgi:hypothetical protein